MSVQQCAEQLIHALKSAESSGSGESNVSSIWPEDLRPLVKCDQAPLAIAGVILSYDAEATDIEYSSWSTPESSKFNSLSTIHNVFGDQVLGPLVKLLARMVRAHNQREDLLVRSQCDLASALAYALLCKKETIEPDDLVFLQAAAILWDGNHINRIDDQYTADYIDSLGQTGDSVASRLKELLTNTSYPIVFDHNMAGGWLLFVPTGVYMPLDNWLLERAYRADIDKRKYDDLRKLLKAASDRYKRDRSTGTLIVLKCIICYIMSRVEDEQARQDLIDVCSDDGLWDDTDFSGAMKWVAARYHILSHERSYEVLREWSGHAGDIVGADSGYLHFILLAQQVGRRSVPSLVAALHDIELYTARVKELHKSKEDIERLTRHRSEAENWIVEAIEAYSGERFKASLFAGRVKKVKKWWKKGAELDWAD